MKTRLTQGFAVLLALALFIWLRDRQWARDAQDTLPCLLAFPAAYWLGRPWSWRDTPQPTPPSGIAAVAAIFLAGIALDSALVLAIAWTLALAVWLRSSLSEDAWPRVRPLLVIAGLGFPWVYLDAQPLGWWFRISGAAAVGAAFQAIGIGVRQQGTSLLIQGMPMDIEPACSGLNALQSLLLGGAAMAYIFFGPSRRFWLNIPLLLPAAWLANTLRLIVICISGLSYGVPFAMGVFHKTGGWMVIVTAFAGLSLLFSSQTAERNAATR